MSNFATTSNKIGELCRKSEYRVWLWGYVGKDTNCVEPWCRSRIKTKNDVESNLVKSSRRLATFVERFVYKCFFAFTCDAPRGDASWQRLGRGFASGLPFGEFFLFSFLLKSVLFKKSFLFFKNFFFLMTSNAMHVWATPSKALLWQGMSL